MSRVWLLVLACLIWSVLLSVVHAAPPENADPSLSPWFRSLQRPDVSGSCCDSADCRPVIARTGPNGWRALLKPADFPVSSETWVDIPNEKILRGHDNPLGAAVVCWIPNMGVLCFIEPAGV